ncbi:hypothetical protein SAMN04488039_103648 [Sulfitobacter dubius]|nr:hypothetical protein SAMN04488039_103648 [Sulfitobacter dubius]
MFQNPDVRNLTDASGRTKVSGVTVHRLLMRSAVSVLEMYHDFRKQFPKLTRAADAKHLQIWGSVDDDTAYVWFESLAATINDQMVDEKQRTDIASVFTYFQGQLRAGSHEVENCIEVSLIENLFWEVKPSFATSVWPQLPKSMQRLYLNFHGRPPTQE